ncbi:MAG: acetylornithine/succinyldiaminopimelate transaminase [Succinivibrio sp.]|nr:acetylornithine/succinyldiaminopimelate transaminase [Succinivibrio sp.]
MELSRQTFDKVMFPCYQPFDMMLTHGHGSYVYDSEENRYLDLTGGIAVNCLGHTPDEVQEVIREQASRLIHVSNIFTNNKTLELAQRLTDATGFERVFFVNSGTEANEAALKLARRVAFDDFGEEKNEIIAFDHSFHGRTFFAVCVAGQDKYSSGFGPKPGAITHLKYNDLEAIESHISDKTCAVIVEPVQGEGGIIPADPLFMKRLRALCDQHRALLIFDEVQTGVGRSGSLYAYMQCPVKPDILTTAKGLGSGLPIGAVLSSSAIAAHFGPGTHGSTFGGNALACAVGCYVLQKVGSEKFLSKVRAKGELLRNLLTDLGERHGVFAQVRGQGLLLGCVLAKPYQGQSAKLQKLCFKHGLLTLVAGPDVLRLAPALNIKKAQLREGAELLELALLELKEA